MTTSTASVNPRPAPLANHWISELTHSFQDAILINDVGDLNHLNAIYDRYMASEPDALKFDRSQLLNTIKTIRDVHSTFLDALQENYFSELFGLFQDAIHQD